MPLEKAMDKPQIKAGYKKQLAELKFEYKNGKNRRKYAHRIRREELRFILDNAEKDRQKAAKHSLREEKREYKKESFLQKSIYLEKRAALKKKRREALGSVVQLVTERAPESLVGSLTLNYVLIILIFALLQGIFVVGSAYYVIDRRATDSLLTMAESMEASGGRRELAEALAKDSAVNISLYDASENCLYSCGFETNSPLPYNQQWEEPFTHQQQTELMRVYSKKIQTEQGLCLLNLAKSLKTESAILSLMINLLLISIALLVSISYFVGYRTTRKLLRPIGVLGRAMEEMSAAHLSDRLETAHIRTELIEVVESYNRMLDKIEGAYERQKQFVSDASHELRTPLAVIRGYSDILSRWGAEDPAVLKEAAEAIQAQSTAMQALLDRLLEIARSDNGTLKADCRPLPLLPICEELLQDFRLLHPARSFSAEGEATAFADKKLMRQILTILLDNAAKFTAEGGKIRLLLEQREGNAYLTVEDDGIGMSEEIAAHIFERFYKGDSSHNAKGYGLGLSIAKLMTELQGGSIQVSSRPGEGSAFTVKLPQ